MSARGARTDAEQAFDDWVQELVADIDYLDLIARAEHAGVSVDDLDEAFGDAEIIIMWSTPVKKGILKEEAE